MECKEISSPLLQEVIDNTGTKNKAVKANSLFEVLHFSKISRIAPKPEHHRNEEEEFCLNILREQFREIKFYRQQANKNRHTRPPGDNPDNSKIRLNLALKAMTMTIKDSEECLLSDFFKSIKPDKDCWFFIASSFVNSNNPHSAFFKRILAEE